jgi:hypothetical protein
VEVRIDEHLYVSEGGLELPTFGSQIAGPQNLDLRKCPETCCDLGFWLINGSRRFVMLFNASRPADGRGGCELLTDGSFVYWP